MAAMQSDQVLIGNLVLSSALYCIFISIGSCIIIKPPLDTSVLKGQPTRLYCSITPRSGECSWYHFQVGKGNKDRGRVYSGGQVWQPYDKDFDVDRNDSTGSCDLIINNAIIEYGGTYLCQNGGDEKSAKAELTVLASDLVCSNNFQSRALTGPNDCGRERDKVHFSCGINFNGNNPPELELGSVKNNQNYSSSNSCSCNNSLAGHVSCSCTLNADIGLDGKYFFCQVGDNPQYRCKTDPVKLLYAIGNKTPLAKTVGDIVECAAETNLPNCNYNIIWSNEFERLIVSEKQSGKVEKVGKYLCEATCNLNEEKCRFDAMVVKASAEEKPYEMSNTALRVIAAAAVIIAVAVVVIAIRAVCPKANGCQSGSISPKLMKLLKHYRSSLNGDNSANMQGNYCHRCQSAITSELMQMLTLSNLTGDVQDEMPAVSRCPSSGFNSIKSSRNATFTI